MKNLATFPALAIILSAGCAEPPPADPVTWSMDSTEEIGGHPVLLLGNPELVQTAAGMVLVFDGIDDGLQLPVHPLAGAREFTVEVFFQPDRDGPAEQRFLHLQEEGSKDRIMLETRLTQNGRWYLDTHIESKGVGRTLYNKKKTHPTGQWQHVALVVDKDGMMRNYVDGIEELVLKIDYKPQGKGATSIGVRMNEVYWFKGKIRRLVFTPRALDPLQFMRH